MKSPLGKFLNEEKKTELMRTVKANTEDVVLLAAGQQKKVVSRILMPLVFVWAPAKIKLNLFKFKLNLVYFDEQEITCTSTLCLH